MPLVPRWCIDHAETEVVYRGHHIPVAADKPDVDAFLTGLMRRMELNPEWREGIEYARLEYARLAREETERGR